MPSMLDFLKKTAVKQPMVIVVGNRRTQEQVFVFAEGEMLEAKSVISALDKTFKLLYICNMQYSRPACHVWQFVQKGLYDIRDEQTTFASVKMLMAYLKRMK